MEPGTPKAYTKEQIEKMEATRAFYDERAKKRGAIEGEDGRLQLTDEQMHVKNIENICEQFKTEVRGIKLYVNHWREDEMGYCLGIGGHSAVWDIGKDKEQIREVFEFAKKIAENETETEETIMEKVDQFVTDKDMERGADNYSI